MAGYHPWAVLPLLVDRCKATLKIETNFAAAGGVTH
jgi:hypothetical protein